jgi:pimeloyl-ACP methyl ester carboxylesterase
VLRRAGWRPSPRLAEGWQAFGSLGHADTRRAFLSTARAVIGPGGQTVIAHDDLPLAGGVPTLIVWGSNDRIIPSSHAEAARRAIPGSQLEIFEQAGHFPHLDQPTRFADILSTFVATTSRPISPAL